MYEDDRMINSSDDRTPDLFDIHLETITDHRVAICHLVSAITDGDDRARVARRAGEILGRGVSRAMIDAWASPRREAHNLPAYVVPALEQAQGRRHITDYLVAQHGGRVSYGTAATRAALDAEQAELDAARQRIARRMRELRTLRQRIGGDAA